MPVGRLVDGADKQSVQQDLASGVAGFETIEASFNVIHCGHHSSLG